MGLPPGTRPSEALIDGVSAERGRINSTAIVSFLLAVVLTGAFFLAQRLPVGGWRDFVQALIPNFVVVLVAFTFIVLSRGLGLWGRGDKLDAIVAYLDRQVKARVNEVRIFDNSTDVPWNEVFNTTGPVNLMANFAGQPMRLGALGLRKSLNSRRSGHVFVFLDPDATDAVAQLASSRAALSYANTPDSVVLATRESVGLLLELLPPGRYDMDMPVPGVTVLLSAAVLPFAAYWTTESALVVNREVSSQGLVHGPRILTFGDSSVRVREYVSSVVEEVRSDDPKTPTLKALLAIATPAYDSKWRAKIERKFHI